MRKIIPLSLIALTSINAADIELAPISVESTTITEVSQKAQISADLAQALSESVPSIDMNRRSGIANDIYIRGQKRDNISVEVDGTKVCGACPNRMDPPASHILANQINEIEVIEGPYDVETFGTLSGGVKITTKKPQKGFHGEVNYGYGSFSYMKTGLSSSGGDDTLRYLISASTESSAQYKDGNGDTLAQQLKNYVTSTADLTDDAKQYSPANEDMRAYDKKSVMAKLFVNPTKNQELRFSVTANRSDNVLYPSSAMDALYDDSNIFSAEYELKDISDLYKNLNLQYYYSNVDHPMSTMYRKSSMMMEMTSHLSTEMQGLRIKNNFDINSYRLLVGVDGSQRVWDGSYYKDGVLVTDSALLTSKSIDNSITTNMAAFAKIEKSFGDFSLTLGTRVDSTEVTSDDTNQSSNSYTGINANILTSYNLNEKNKIFFGLGQATRVPDARELYFKKNKWMPMPTSIVVSGNDNLKQTVNQEIDFGYEATYDTFKLKAKAFYSMLSDYIYYRSDVTQNNFTNIDATVYGTELSSSIYPTDELSIDASLAYKVGTKKEALLGQTSTALADITPLRAKLAINYEYMHNSFATIEAHGSDTWDNYDADNGEQVIAAWSIVNMKVKHTIEDNMDLTFGINNLFNEVYAMSNTYTDLTLISAGTDDTMLLNEPGRYIYSNMTLKF